MTKHIRISLVIPAYNEERYLRQCLLAIQRQTTALFEVIVVDNNSSDRTSEVAREFPFVRLLHEKRQGLRFARDTGMNAARGDVIGRIDADTYLERQWSERVAEAFADPATTCLTGACFYHDMPAQRAGYVMDRTCRSLAFKLGKPMFYGSNMAMRKSVWRQLRLVACKDGEFFEDSDLSIHANELGHTIIYLPVMIAGVSARRLDDTPSQFYRVMQEFDHTFQMHGQSNGAARVAKFIYLAGFPFLKLIRKCYDVETDTFVLARAFTAKAAARPTSNT